MEQTPARRPNRVSSEPPMPWMYILTCIVGCAWAYSLCIESFWAAYPALRLDPQGMDFYPIYVAVQQILEGKSPFDPAVSEFLQTHWTTAQTTAVAPVVAYPLPALIPFVPLGLMNVAVAQAIFLLVAVSGIAYGIRQLTKHPLDWLGVFLWWPLYDAIAIRQAFLVWIGLAFVALFGLRTQPAWVVGGAAGMLLYKPQAGLILFAVTMLRAWHVDKHIIAWALGTVVALFAMSMAMDPLWPLEWYASLQSYRATAATEWMLPHALVLLGLCWRMPWFVACLVAQVILFPVGSTYSLAILLPCWMCFRRSVMLPGIGMGLAALALFEHPMNTAVFHQFLLLPLEVACIFAIVERIDPRIRVLRPVPSAWSFR